MNGTEFRAMYNTNPTMSAMVREFMVKNFQHLSPGVSNVPDDVKVLRLRLMMEELGELAQAMHENNIVQIADGGMDLLYVVIGTMLSYGIPVEECFAEVHASNMSKPRLDKHNKGGKVTKGTDGAFRKPNLEAILWRDDEKAPNPALPFSQEG